MTYTKLKILLVLLSSFTLVSAKRQIIFNSASLSVLCVDTDEEENNVLSKTQSPCPLPVSDLISGRTKPATMGDYYTEPPEWLNVTLATIGQDYMRKNAVGYFYGILLQTMLPASVTEVERVIHCAAKGATPKQYERQFVGNILNPMFWANGDIGPGLHHPTNAYRWNQSSLYEGLNLIRSIHDKAAQQASVTKERFRSHSTSQQIYNVAIDNDLWDAFQIDLEASHLVSFKNKSIVPKRNNVTQFPFNQFSIALQYWAHMVGPFLNPERSLYMANPTEEELLGYLHFWSFLAHVMGMSEEYNIGLQPSVLAAKKYFREFFEMYFLPGLFQLEYEAKVLLESYMQAFFGTFPFMDCRLLVKLLAEDILVIKSDNIQKLLSPQAKFYSSILQSTRRSVKNSRINPTIRFLMNGMIQVRTLKIFGYNILVPDAYTNGLLQTNELILNDLELWELWRKKT